MFPSPRTELECTRYICGVYIIFRCFLLMHILLVLMGCNLVDKV